MRNPLIRGEDEPPVDALPHITPRLIKGMQADYEPAVYPGENQSGLFPFGTNLLVQVDTCAGASSGGVILPDDIIERMTEASVTGCIYAIGPKAHQALGDGLEVGQRVCFEKYAGVRQRGKDGRIYRVIDERSIACRIADDFCAGEL